MAPGLDMQVVDAAGRLLGQGARLRVVAPQDETLFVHVFGRSDSSGVRGAGAYSLVIDTLPQLVDIEAQSLLPGHGDQPGGPTTSLVLVFQGDRLTARPPRTRPTTVSFGWDPTGCRERATTDRFR